MPVEWQFGWRGSEPLPCRGLAAEGALAVEQHFCLAMFDEGVQAVGATCLLHQTPLPGDGERPILAPRVDRTVVNLEDCGNFVSASSQLAIGGRDFRDEPRLESRSLGPDGSRVEAGQGERQADANHSDRTWHGMCFQAVYLPRKGYDGAA